MSFSETPCVITFLFNVGCYDKISVIDIERSLGCRSIPECSNFFWHFFFFSFRSKCEIIIVNKEGREMWNEGFDICVCFKIVIFNISLNILIWRGAWNMFQISKKFFNKWFFNQSENFKGKNLFHFFILILWSRVNFCQYFLEYKIRHEILESRRDSVLLIWNIGDEGNLEYGIFQELSERYSD